MSSCVLPMRWGALQIASGLIMQQSLLMNEMW